MKKTFTQIISVCFFIAIGIAGGILLSNAADRIVSPDESIGRFLLAMVFGLLIFYLASFLQIIIHEGGHYIFGKLTGYRFVSFRILSLTWKRSSNGTVFTKYSLAGTGGQALMEPPGECGSDFPVVLYNMGGCLLNVITALIFILLAKVFYDLPWLWMFCTMMCAVGIGYALLNGIPLKLGVNNDGLNTLDLVRNPRAKRAFWISMKANALITDGVSIGDMPEEWFTLPQDEDMDNGIIAYIPYAACDRLVTLGRYDEAEALRRDMLKRCTGLPDIYRNIMFLECIFYELTHENRKEVIDTLWTKDLQKNAKAMRSLPPVLRTECLLAKVYSHDEAESAKLKQEYDRLLETYPFVTEGINDRKLLEDALAAARG